MMPKQTLVLEAHCLTFKCMRTMNIFYVDPGFMLFTCSFLKDFFLNFP